ncbi:MAG: hypothetical protein R3E84_19375 [Pseudomonadales bacterium]
MAAKSVSGDVNVQCRQALQHGDVSSVSGDAQLRCAPSDGSDLRLASISGDVIFTLSGGNATIRADAGPSGDISRLSLRGETRAGKTAVRAATRRSICALAAVTRTSGLLPSQAIPCLRGG